MYLTYSKHLLAEGPLADWLEPFLQVVEVIVVAQPGEAGAVGLQVAEGEIVDDADQAVEFQERVLQRRGGQEHLAERGHALLDGVGNLVRGLVHVAEPVGFVDDHQIPACLADVRLHLPGEMVRTDNDGVLLERIEVAGPDGVVEGPGFQDGRWQEELVGQFLAPLLPQVGRHDDQDATLAFRPALVDQEPGLDGFPQPDFVGQDGAAGKRVAEGEECRLDLVRIEIDLGIGQDRRQLLNAVGSTTPRQFVGDVLGVVRRELHGITSTGGRGLCPGLTPASGPVGCSIAILSRHVIIISVRSECILAYGPGDFAPIQGGRLSSKGYFGGQQLATTG